jgi:Ser/Thr protein kinase RdoA (MazF antagonist)
VASVTRRGSTTGVVHGDYYRRNILCRDRRIVGIIDWHEVRRAPLMSELAFAGFEMAHDDDLSFLPERARVFLDAYRGAGPIPSAEYGSLMSFMRLGLRDNARYAMDAARRGGLSDPEYIAMQARAFAALRSVTGI